jgi:hypothetical protein
MLVNQSHPELFRRDASGDCVDPFHALASLQQKKRERYMARAAALDFRGSARQRSSRGLTSIRVCASRNIEVARAFVSQVFHAWIGRRRELQWSREIHERRVIARWKCQRFQGAKPS